VSETTDYFSIRPVLPDAYVEFAELAPEKDAIIQFANRHGWLGFPDCIHTADVDPVKARGLGGWIPVSQEGAVDGTALSSRYVVQGESLSRWKDEIHGYAAYFELWRAAKANDVNQLSKMIKRHKDVAFSFRWGKSGRSRSPGNHGLSFISAANPSENPPRHRDFDLDKFPAGSLIEPAKAFVIRKINSKLKDNLFVGVRFTEGRRDPFRVEPYVVAKTLLAAIWLQFSELLTGVRAYKTCEICGKLMDVSECARKASKRVHDSCSNRRRMARYRNKLSGR